jgi:hypothetical protein
MTTVTTRNQISDREQQLWDKATADINSAIERLLDGGWKEEARDLERDLRTSVTLADLLMVREDADDLLSFLGADA